MDPLEEIALQLKELNATTRQLLEVSGLQFALEPLRYIARKLRTGEAIPRVTSTYQVVAPGATFALTIANPAGYVWIGIYQSVEVSQNGVFEFTGYVDDEIIPKTYIPRGVSHIINWSETIPFGHVIRDRTTLIVTNHDIANQWVVTANMAIYLRKDVWERDIKLMDRAAEKYMYPAPPPTPPH